jgi:hypothetical protein
MFDFDEMDGIKQTIHCFVIFVEPRDGQRTELCPSTIRGTP